MESMDAFGLSLEPGDCSLHPAYAMASPARPRWSALIATRFDGDQQLLTDSCYRKRCLLIMEGEDGTQKPLPSKGES